MVAISTSPSVAEIDALIDIYGQSVYSFCHFVSNDHELASKATQEALVEVWSKAHAIPDEALDMMVLSIAYKRVTSTMWGWFVNNWRYVVRGNSGGTLSPMQRACLYLVSQLHLNYQRVGLVLGIDENRVRSEVYRARISQEFESSINQ